MNYEIINNNFGVIVGGVLVGMSSIISTLSFINDGECDKKNDGVQKALSISLILFSLVGSVFERHLNKKLLIKEMENEELKTELGKSKKDNESVINIDNHNEPFDNEPQYYQTNRSDTSDMSFYPPAVRF